MSNYNTVYVGMDVHKESFSLCCFQIGDKQPSYPLKITADYKLVLKYIEKMHSIYGKETEFVCGYEAGCLGYTLYRQLTARNIKCVILAPSTMLKDKKRVKTDKRDAGIIAKCLAFGTYSPVYIPSKEDEQIKEFIRMRDDHVTALKRLKQQISSFCLRLGYSYNETKTTWTIPHVQWLKKLDLEGVYKDTLTEYLLTFDYLTEKIKWLDEKIETFASKEEYCEKVKALSCFIGIKPQSALATIVEIGDFKRFPKAAQFASYLGLVPGEFSSGDSQIRLGITKAGNSHIRKLMVEAAQGYNRSSPLYKSKTMKARQKGCPPEIIAYADRANDRLRRKYLRMVLGEGKRANVAKTAIARELACFVWGVMTDHID